jgi:hypothetical protein
MSFPLGILDSWHGQFAEERMFGDGTDVLNFEEVETATRE